MDDLLAGARHLQRYPPDRRHILAQSLLYQAHAAHCYAKRFGAPHPRWGNGSLMARALADMPNPADQSPLCFDSLAIMADAITRFRQRLAVL
jgi:hypothetical protein